MIFPANIVKGFAAAFDRYVGSPFRRRRYEGALDVEAIEWVISWMQSHPDVQENPNSLMWLDRLRANLHHYRLDQTAASRGSNSERAR